MWATWCRSFTLSYFLQNFLQIQEEEKGLFLFCFFKRFLYCAEYEDLSLLSTYAIVPQGKQNKSESEKWKEPISVILLNHVLPLF